MPQGNFSTTELITLGIALLGVVLSAISLGWNIYRDIMEKGRLKVDCYIGVHDDRLGNITQDLFVLSITNIGYRPVIISIIGIEFSDHGLVLNTMNRLPHKLEPGEYIIEYYNDLSMLTKKIKNVLVNDTLGKNYKAPHKRLKQAIKSAKKKLKN